MRARRAACSCCTASAIRITPRSSRAKRASVSRPSRLRRKGSLGEHWLAGEERGTEALPLIDSPGVMLETGGEEAHQGAGVENGRGDHSPKPRMCFGLVARSFGQTLHFAGEIASEVVAGGGSRGLAQRALQTFADQARLGAAAGFGLGVELGEELFGKSQGNGPHKTSVIRDAVVRCNTLPVAIGSCEVCVRKCLLVCYL